MIRNLNFWNCHGRSELTTYLVIDHGVELILEAESGSGHGVYNIE